MVMIEGEEIEVTTQKNQWGYPVRFVRHAGGRIYRADAATCAIWDAYQDVLRQLAEAKAGGGKKR